MIAHVGHYMVSFPYIEKVDWPNLIPNSISASLSQKREKHDKRER